MLTEESKKYVDLFKPRLFRPTAKE